MSLLYKTIHDRATATWRGGTVTKEVYPQWEDHWFSTADRWRNELIQEGLMTTAATVARIIDQQRAIQNRR